MAEFLLFIPTGNYYVYISTNPAKTVLYTGVTNDLDRRMSEHYENRGCKDNFAGKYYCYKLVYYEHYSYARHAIDREKEIKLMKRKDKEALISSVNPKWNTIR